MLTIVTVLQFWQVRYKCAQDLSQFLFDCVKENNVLQALHPSSNRLYTKSKSMILRPLKGESGYELSTSKLSTFFDGYFKSIVSHLSIADNVIAFRYSSVIYPHLMLSPSHPKLCVHVFS